MRHSAQRAGAGLTYVGAVPTNPVVGDDVIMGTVDKDSSVAAVVGEDVDCRIVRDVVVRSRVCRVVSCRVRVRVVS